MEREYPVPGFDKYTVTEDGKVYSYKRENRKQLKPSVIKNRRRDDEGVCLCREDSSGKKIRKFILIHRLLCSVKLGREIYDWEQVRHMDGDPTNNHMSNLEVGCALLNTIDDLEAGTRKTSLEYIDEAMKRLSNLRAVYEKEE